MIKKTLILGDHIQALGIARIIGKLGIEVELFNEYRGAVARFSKYCNKFHLFYDENELINKLTLGDFPKNTLIIPTNDKMVKFLADNYKFLNNLFHLAIPKPNIVDICYNKIQTYKTAQKLGIPIPESFFPTKIEDVKDISKIVNYPVIIKPAIMYYFHKITGKKVFLCNSKSELLSNYKKITKIIPTNEVIIQEFISGGASNLYSFCSFVENKNIHGSFIANRIRQKPMDFGISTTFARSVVNLRIEELAGKFLNGINYFGLSEVEFMYDEKIDDYKLIEINPRTWKWHTISNKLNINLLEMMIKYFQGENITEKHNIIDKVGWIERITDSYVALKEILEGRLTLSEYFKSLKIEKESAVLSKDDPLPALMYVILLPYLFYKRG